MSFVSELVRSICPDAAVGHPPEGSTAPRCGAYQLRLASSEQDRTAIFRLRFEVFNLELREGLEGAYINGQDCDEFDLVCDHLLVEHWPTGAVVGTYRLQTGAMAAPNLGYYSAREFDFSPYEPLRSDMIELGRACIRRDHRSFDVLNLLWKGVAQYSISHGGRYLIGCSSLTSQDIDFGSAMYFHLSSFLTPTYLRTAPVGSFAFELTPKTNQKVKPPKLLRAYLSIGAQICGPPAIDREFKTIDFLTLLDLQSLNPTVRARFLGA